MQVTVLNNQTLFDVAIQYTGNADNCFAIALANNISITDELFPGQLIEIPESIEIETEIVKYFSTNKIQPATATTKEINDILNPTLGIGSMAIGVTFEIG